MARIALLATAVLALAQPIVFAADTVVDIPEGEFYRPSGAEVSGVLNATTLYTRSPCPVLNTMANHGLLPRDGKNLSRPLIQAAIMKLFNLDDTLASSMVSQAPNTTFTLADLSKHGMIEHDVSFSRADAYFGGEPSQTTPAHMQELLALANPSLTLEKTAWLAARRLAECKATNPTCEFTTLKFTADFQRGLLLRVLGGQNKEEISFEFLHSFFADEKLPTGYTKPSPAVQLTDIMDTVTALGKVDTTTLTFALPVNSTQNVTTINETATAAPTEAPKSHAMAVTTGLITTVTALVAWIL